MSTVYDMNSSGFVTRHCGSNSEEIVAMLTELGCTSIDDLIKKVIPSDIQLIHDLKLPLPVSEEVALQELYQLADQNKLLSTYIGLGYHGTYLPAVIRRGILENPGWYTAYTPYQAEISQGRLEALLNFQTLITDLTGLSIANASLLDEATAAAEAMYLAYSVRNIPKFFVSQNVHPHIQAVLMTRAEALGIELIIDYPCCGNMIKCSGGIFQYPGTDGVIDNPSQFIESIHQLGGLAVIISDPLALVLLESPATFGADIAVGSTQRFGVPMGYGGPHAAYFATKDEFKRRLPGRLVGVSHDVNGHLAYRLTMQTREQHIRRERATSNICTSQVLLAIIASMYAVYHGPQGLYDIAHTIHTRTSDLAKSLHEAGWDIEKRPFFDTIRINLNKQSYQKLKQRALKQGINFRWGNEMMSISLDETVQEIDSIIQFFGSADSILCDRKEGDTQTWIWSSDITRKKSILQHPVFNTYHTETEMLRYMHSLESKDISLTFSMIPLGSCTMKLNATTEMIPLGWNKINSLHPFVPLEQSIGYQKIFEQLESWLKEITGLDAISLQPNAGSQGEYSGLLAIKQYYSDRGEKNRSICFIPKSAHGTNPASASIAGFKVVEIGCDMLGNIDIEDFKKKIGEYGDQLAVLMITYPSTHGVFEDSIQYITSLAHQAGAQVYLDGANMNAQISLCSPKTIGADICHLNFHKSFCIPHGGGGPGAGPVATAEHLAPYLPGHPFIEENIKKGGVIAGAPWGSASLYVISWMYIRMMGASGLKMATQLAILHANYIAHRLKDYFPILYHGKEKMVAHEVILDFRSWKDEIGINVEDIAKRLIDYGFHAPTMSWPVVGTLMIEPTESESKEEIDRFCEAIISIYHELLAIKNGRWSREDNPLKYAPHTIRSVTANEWSRCYTREEAAWPLEWLYRKKFWSPVSRIDNLYGEKNIFCSCSSDWKS